jgi:hypothetical protein
VLVIDAFRKNLFDMIAPVQKLCRNEKFEFTMALHGWKFRNMSQTFYANIMISFLLQQQKQLNNNSLQRR